MTDWENTYETLLRMRSHKDRVEKHLARFTPWLSAEEIGDMKKTLGELERDVKELEKMCVEEGTCPDCGSKITEVKCTNPYYPYEWVDICEGCGRIWDKWD